MIAELATVAGLGIAAAFKKGPLRPAEANDFKNNLISPAEMARCTLTWSVAKSGTPLTAVDEIIFPLDFNPTRLKVRRAPYFSAGQSSAGARLGANNVAYAPGTPYIELDFMLDNTEVLDEIVAGKKVKFDSKTSQNEYPPHKFKAGPQMRVLDQMRILHSMLEPIGFPQTTAIVNKQPGDPTKPYAHALTPYDSKVGDALSGSDQVAFRKHADYKKTARHPTGVWLHWGPVTAFGAVRNLDMTVTAVDGLGHPRRTHVFLRMKGEIFGRESEYAELGYGKLGDKFEKAPGGSVLDPEEIHRTQVISRVLAGHGGHQVRAGISMNLEAVGSIEERTARRALL